MIFWLSFFHCDADILGIKQLALHIIFYLGLFVSSYLDSA